MVSPRKNFFAGAGTETVVDENGVDNCTDKQGFYVFDFCDVFEFFGAHPDGKTAKSVKSISQKIFDCKTEIVKELQGLPIIYSPFKFLPKRICIIYEKKQVGSDTFAVFTPSLQLKLR